MPPLLIRTFAAGCIAFSTGMVRGALADEPAPASAATTSTFEVAADELHAQLSQIVTELDSERYFVREAAARRLNELAESAPPSLLFAELKRLNLDPGTSFEVRSSVEPLLERLAARPEVQTAPESEGLETVPTPDEIKRLATALASDDYSSRVGAAARLEWLLREPRAVGPIYSALKQFLAEPTLGAGARRELAPLLDSARGAWLLLDPKDWAPSTATEAQVEAWIDDLVRKRPSRELERHRDRQQNAERELLDLLARDERVDPVARALEARLAEPGLDDESRLRLESILHWTRPALVAEFWEIDPSVGDLPTGGLRHQGVQYLLVNVATLGEGAERPSHFDRIDDRTAHCVSGNALAPGDYPVGVLFPHPQRDGAFFHLVNLPTPGRRLAYDYSLRRDEAVRAREVSRRTIDRLAAERRPLTFFETMMLGAVDPDEFSRFAGQYLNAIDDEPLVEILPPNFPCGQTSRHGLLCLMLAERGRPSAIPGLLKAIEARRILPPTQEAPCDLPWVAALAIASRVKKAEEWPDVDRWLAKLVERTEPIVLPRARRPDAPPAEGELAAVSCPELGATAAALLLRRHGISPSVYGLSQLGSQLLAQVGCPGHEFTLPGAREELLAWWHKGRQPDTTSAAASAPRR